MLSQFLLVVIALLLTCEKSAQTQSLSGVSLSTSDVCHSILSLSSDSSDSDLAFTYGVDGSICAADARYLLNTAAPTIYKALTLANATSHCAHDVALLFCLVLLTPSYTNSRVCQSVCLDVFSAINGSCSIPYRPYSTTTPQLTSADASSFYSSSSSLLHSSSSFFSSSSSPCSSTSPSSCTLVDLIYTLLPPFAHKIMNCSDASLYMYADDSGDNGDSGDSNDASATKTCRNGAQYRNSSVTTQLPMPTCSPYISSPLHPQFNGSVCAEVIDYDIYIPPDINGPQNNFAFSEIEMLSLSSLFAIAPIGNGCRQTFARLVCASIFPKCDTKALARALPDSPFSNLPVPYPSYPCSSLCLSASSLCGDMYSSLHSTLANFLPPSSTFPIFVLLSCTYAGDFLYGYRSCDSSVNILPQPDRPNVTTVVGVVSATVNNNNDNSFNNNNNNNNNNSNSVYSNVVYVTTECNNVTLPTGSTTSISQAVVTVQCPYPLVIPDDPTTPTILNGACALPCPLLIWTSDEWTMQSRLMTASCIISSVSVTFLALTWIIFPVKRKNENLMNFFIIYFLFFTLLSFGTLSAPSFDRSRLGCLDNSQYVTMYSHRAGDNGSGGDWCKFEGAFVHALPLSGSIWWLLICVELYVKTVIDQILTKAQSKLHTRINRILGWGIPVIFLIAGLCKGVYGRSSSLAFCFMVDAPDRTFHEWLLLYIPVVFCLFTGTVLMMIILFVIVRSHLRVSNGRSDRWWWTQYIRLVIFIIIYDTVFAFLIAFRALSDLNNQIYADSASWYVSCLLTLGSACPLQHPTYRPSLIFVYSIYAVVFGDGLLWLIVFGTQPINFLLWYGLVRGKGLNYCSQSSSEAKSNLGQPPIKLPSSHSFRRDRFNSTPTQARRNVQSGNDGGSAAEMIVNRNPSTSGRRFSSAASPSPSPSPSSSVSASASSSGSSTPAPSPSPSLSLHTHRLPSLVPHPSPSHVTIQLHVVDDFIVENGRM